MYLVTWTLYDKDDDRIISTESFVDTMVEVASIVNRAFTSQCNSLAEIRPEDPESYLPMPQIYVINGTVKVLPEDIYPEPLDPSCKPYTKEDFPDYP